MENNEICQNNFDITEQFAAKEDARLFSLNLPTSQFTSNKLERMKGIYFDMLFLGVQITYSNFYYYSPIVIRGCEQRLYEIMFILSIPNFSTIQ